MIVFRHADTRFPFLWETADQPAARWHDLGEGPVHYFSDTPDGAWAEFLRHEEIVDRADLEGIQRALWSIDVPRTPRSQPRLDAATLTGGISSYVACQREARRIRSMGGRGLTAPSAALESPSPSGFRTDGGLQPGPPATERVVVLFGPRPDLVGWAASHRGRPRADLLPRVRQLAR